MCAFFIDDRWKKWCVCTCHWGVWSLLRISLNKGVGDFANSICDLWLQISFLRLARPFIVWLHVCYPYWHTSIGRSFNPPLLFVYTSVHWSLLPALKVRDTPMEARASFPLRKDGHGLASPCCLLELFHFLITPLELHTWNGSTTQNLGILSELLEHAP